MDKHSLYILTLSILLFTIVLVLAVLGESRLDVYVSLFTISYLASSVIFRPRRKIPDVIGFILTVIFGVIVVLRVMEIMGWWIPI